MRTQLRALLALCALAAGCQCVQLPTELRCTAGSCGDGEVCADDGRCVSADAGCTPRTSCAAENRECGLLDTGCGEELCGGCGAGLTCGSVQAGRCAPCNPAAADEPDPEFVDSNCDGLDGTVDGGLFVDPQLGSDLSPGTRARPLYSLTKAAEVVSVTPSIHTVFIAEGVTGGLTWRAPVSLAGGYRATTGWSRTRTALTTVRAAGTGLRLESVPAGVSLSLLSVEATQGVEGTATVGLTLVDSPVMLQQLVIRAGDGAPGPQGRLGDAGAAGVAGGAGGVGTSGQLCAADGGCGFEPVPGSGGDGGVGACGTGAPGLTPSLPGAGKVRDPLDAALTREVVTECDSCPCTARGGGPEMIAAGDAAAAGAVDAGPAGGPAVSGPADLGGLDGGWWFPSFAAEGDVGGPGAPGAGGPPGGSAIYEIDRMLFGVEIRSVALGSSGGGGGSPGCGGRPGGGGGLGGASIGLVVVGAAPVLDGVGVIAGRGGAGGPAGLGGPGGPGGAGGPGGPRWTADCQLPGTLSVFALNPPQQPPTGNLSYFTAGEGGPGGQGGTGGPGGPGAPGAGGPSVGVWCERTTVPLAQLQVLVSEGGSGGVPGLAVTSVGCQ